MSYQLVNSLIKIEKLCNNSIINQKLKSMVETTFQRNKNPKLPEKTPKLLLISTLGKKRKILIPIKDRKIAKCKPPKQ